MNKFTDDGLEPLNSIDTLTCAWCGHDLMDDGATVETFEQYLDSHIQECNVYAEEVAGA